MATQSLAPAPALTPAPAGTGTGDATDGLIAALVQRLGPDAVDTAIARRTFFSTDMSRHGAVAAAVVAPADVAALAAAVELCTAAGLAVIPRGGGFSYTGGYVPVSTASVVVDLRRLDRIVEINATDMYVVVEAGVTWAALYEALKAQGLRTPYFGPMSGFGATVGGALSQGSFFLGSTQYGVVAESVLGLEIVLADGTLLRTGSWGGAEGTPPFLRNYGPDLTGVFLSDTGAMGFKSRAALKLIPFPPHQDYASIAFADEAAAIAALSAVGRAGVAAECYLWDPYFVKVMAEASTGLRDDLRFLGGVARGGGSLLRGIRNAARVAGAGRRSFGGDVFVLNVTIDDLNAAGAAARLAAVHAIAATHGGQRLTPSAPMAMRGTPFTNFNTAERRRPLRNLPAHGLTTHSRAPALGAAIRAIIDDAAAGLADLGVSCGVIYFAVGTQVVCCEPIPYWEDLEHFSHDRVNETSDTAALGGFTERPAATRAVLALRERFYAVFRDAQCGHVQIGKSYPWLDTRAPAAAAAFRDLKHQLDPRGLMNPGALGFGR